MSEPATAPAAPAAPPATENAAPAQKRTRPPLDEAARAAASRRATVKRLTKKVGGAKSEEEFWQLAGELAKKQGRALDAPKAAAVAEVDPLDKPIKEGWPSARAVEQAKDVADGLLMQLAAVAKGTRYEKPASDAQASCAVPLAACVAKYAADINMGPGAALALSAGLAFGPTLAAHAYEVAAPRIAAWWVKRGEAAQTAPVEVTRLDKKKGA